jgi:hypothetical protein
VNLGRVACCCILGLLGVSAISAREAADSGLAEPSASLAPEVEWAVARTKPLHWERRRACLYYALAGQGLLARLDVPATLRFGSVVYAPGTPAAYPIDPHAWLETPTGFVDYATLPRWGAVTVIPRELVATTPWEVRPGVTRVLAQRWPEDAALRGYLATHRSRFEHILRRETSGWPRPGGRWAWGDLERPWGPPGARTMEPARPDPGCLEIWVGRSGCCPSRNPSTD